MIPAPGRVGRGAENLPRCSHMEPDQADGFVQDRP